MKFKERLLKLIETLPKAEVKYQNLKYKKEKRFAELYLEQADNFRTESLRQCAVKKILEDEGIIMPMLEAGYKYHKLLNEKDILMKIYE